MRKAQEDLFAKSFANLLSGSYGLAEGSSTNADTALLASGFVRSGRAYYVYASLWERDLQGFYWTRQFNGSGAANMFMAQTGLTTTTRFDYVGTGFVVRCTSFTHLLSGSYGLAVVIGNLIYPGIMTLMSIITGVIF